MSDSRRLVDVLAEDWNAPGWRDGMDSRGSDLWREAVAAKHLPRGLTEEQRERLLAAIRSGASVGEAVRLLKDTP